MSEEYYVIIGDKECIIPPDLVKKYGVENISKTPFTQREIKKRESRPSGTKKS
jgi:hypothetical protein